jgi:hypothetical protein
VRAAYSEAKQVSKNIKGLLQALQQSINESILESNDVAAAMAALKRTGKCPVFTINISMQDPSGELSEVMDDPIEETLIEPIARPPGSTSAEELVLSDWDVEFLATLGVCDPSWCQGTPISPRE